MTILFQNAQKIKTIYISFTGILSGLGLLRYVEFLTISIASDTKYPSSMWWTIPLSVSVWMLLRLCIRQSYVTILGAIFCFSVVGYWFLAEDSPIFIASIFFSDNTLVGHFLFAGILIASLIILESFLFSQNAIRFVGLTFFGILFIAEIIPALTNLFSTKVQTFFMSLLIVATLSSMWIVASELLFFVVAELFQKAGTYEKKQ